MQLIQGGNRKRNIFLPPLPRLPDEPQAGTPSGTRERGRSEGVEGVRPY